MSLFMNILSSNDHVVIQKLEAIIAELNHQLLQAEAQIKVYEKMEGNGMNNAIKKLNGSVKQSSGYHVHFATASDYHDIGRFVAYCMD